MMTNLYQVKDFSKLTGVTARTLQYYDEIGLLKPHQKTEAGYRLYSANDLLILQQITTLKFMGFNLKKIKAIISNKHFDIENSLQYQGEVLTKEADRLDKAARLIKQAHLMLKSAG
ncbi:MAG: MerR family transcriptional regulator, partial [Gammaproteobacteria bacterium]